MPRGKNYVNNNKGVTLQASSKSASAMRMCEYGAGCTRPDCIYRHEESGQTEEVCLPFLAGKCTFTGVGCRKIHPNKADHARLLAKYKRTRCRFSDECYTESCLYQHPRDVKATEPSYIEPHNVAFPPLNGDSVATAPQPVASAWKNSAWKVAPALAPSLAPAVVPRVQAKAPAWYPAQPQTPMCAPAYYNDGPSEMDHAAYDSPSKSFNANAKEFIPGSSMA
jgi:hypothetical protein